MNRIVPLMLSALLCAAPLGALPPQETGTQQGAPQSGAARVTVKENIAYASVNGAELHLDVYEPAEPGGHLHPAIVLIHGGGWNSLDKSTMHGMGQFLARFGFVAFAVDYRLFRGNENRWPAQLDDVQRAVRWVRACSASLRRLRLSKDGLTAEQKSAQGILGRDRRQD